jgi:hypothetical protein
MALQHARLAAGERPQAHGAVPRRRGDARAVRRRSERDHRRLVAVEHGRGTVGARRPQGDVAILAGGGDAAVGEDRDGVDRALVEPHHLLGGIARERPADRGLVEAARDRGLAVGRDHERAHRPAMAAQLRACGRRRRDRGECEHDELGGATHHHLPAPCRAH